MNPVLKRTLTGLAVGGAVIAASLLAPPGAIVTVVMVLAVLAMVEFALLMKMKAPRPGAVHAVVFHAVVFLAGALLIGYGLLSLASVPFRYGEGEMCGLFRLGNVMLLYVIAIVKFSDVGGFAFGLTSAKLMKGGNHKLCPTISPNKSWEGLLGSVAVSSLVSCLFMGATGFGWGKSLALGAAAAFLGTAGDLVESKFKRWVGVKDSSAMKMTNGLGGILDMIDSLLIAPPVLLAFL